MANFEQAIDHVLKNESRFVDYLNNPSGATNFGVSMRFLKRNGYHFDYNEDGVFDAEDMEHFFEGHAIDIYREHFWMDLYDQIESQTVATKILDTVVNTGHNRGHKILQKAQRDHGHAIALDGAFGPNTLRAVNAMEPGELLMTFRYVQKKFYESLVEQNSDFSVFIKGWLIRAMRLTRRTDIIAIDGSQAA